MTTTPEQLAKWREEAEYAYAGMGFTHGFDDGAKCYEAGYLRAKQENEQVIKVDDHQIALLVNSVTHIASVYHDNGSLRQRISSEIVPMFQQACKKALEDAIAISQSLPDMTGTPCWHFSLMAGS